MPQQPTDTNRPRFPETTGYRAPRGPERRPEDRRFDDRRFDDRRFEDQRSEERRFDEQRLDGRQFEDEGGLEEAAASSGRRLPPPENQSVAAMPDDLANNTRRWWHREELQAGEIMTRDVKSVTANTPVKEIADLMRREDIGIVPVVDEQLRLLGLVTDRDIVVRGVAAALGVEGMKASDLCSSHVEAAQMDTPVTELLDRMGKKQVRRIPIVDREQRLLGMVSLGDIAHRADEREDLQNALEKISNRRSFWSRIWR